jgi:hypothetical protein
MDEISSFEIPGYMADYTTPLPTIQNVNEIRHAILETKHVDGSFDLRIVSDATCNAQ